ncbi:MAG: hypothetical protein ACE5GR_00675 [Nitrosopumilus sp.]
MNFEIIPDVECDWGSHIVIQCPHCEENYSVDKQCPAFHNIMELLKHNSELFSNKEKFDCLVNSHPS